MRTSLSIAHATAGLELEQGGLAYAIPRMAKAIAAQGHHNHVFSLTPPPNTTPPTAYKSFKSLYCANDFSSIPIARKLGVSRSMRKALPQIRPDLFHAHGLWMMPGIYAANCAHRYNLPLVISTHGMLTLEAMKFSRYKKWLFGLLAQNRALQSAACLHVTSDSELDDLRQMGLTQPVAIIPNGVDAPDLSDLPRTTSPKRKSLLSLGRIHPTKGLDRLIRAWAQIAADFPNWYLDLIGPDQNNYTAQLLRLADSLHAPRVQVSGPVYGREKWQLYRNAKWFVMPSLTEGFGLSVAEALSCETPVICTHGAPWKGLETEKCGYWIPHGPDIMAKTLRQALSVSAAKRRAMGTRGRNWIIRDFSWNPVGKSLSELYLWLCDQGQKPDFVDWG